MTFDATIPLSAARGEAGEPAVRIPSSGGPSDVCHCATDPVVFPGVDRMPRRQAPASALLFRANRPPRQNEARCARTRGSEGDHMGIDDLVNQGKDFLEKNKDQIEQTLKSDQAEDVSDKALDAAAEFVKKIAPDSVDTHVDGVRDNIDKAIGNE
jgi:hypothetical protein